MTDELVIPAPSDYHLHLRQRQVTRAVAPASAWAGRVLVMPNTEPPVLTGAQSHYYGKDCWSALGGRTDVLTTIKLTPETTPDVIKEAVGYGVVAAKLYPAGVTTNSHDGIPADWLVNPVPQQFADVLGAVQDAGMVLCCHGEMPGRPTFSDYDYYETRAGAFLGWLVGAVLRPFPTLRVVLEHVTTGPEVSRVYVEWHNHPGRLAATITPHHLTQTIDDVIGDKLRPHNFCKPVAKTDDDREKLLDAATSGHPAFFLGTDSAPHAVGAKECAECCAGCFSAHAALGTVADVFDRAGALDNLTAFTSGNGDAFYRERPTGRRVKLTRETYAVPKEVQYYVGMTDHYIRPWRYGETLAWSWEDVT